MSGLDKDTIKEFNGFLKWYYSDFETNSKIVDDKFKKLIERWKKEDEKE